MATEVKRMIFSSIRVAFSASMCAPALRQKSRRCRHARGSTASRGRARSEEHTSELQSLMRISYAVFCLKKKKKIRSIQQYTNHRQIYHMRIQLCQNYYINM